MSRERYVAAIEISSSKVIGAVGKLNNDGSLDIIAIAQDKCIECVRGGIIKNVDETASRISGVLAKLEQNSALEGKKIKNVYIGISGRSMKSIPVNVNLNFESEKIIDAAIKETLDRMARTSDIDSSLEIIDAVPRIYKMGHSETHEPVGQLASSICAVYDLIVCRPQIKNNIRLLNLQDRNGVSNCGFIATQLAAAKIILTEEEKRLGCMLVDMGAETTSVTIYKDGNLRYYATLPMGGRNITRDISYLNMLEERAEEIKIQSGNAMPDSTPSRLNFDGVSLADIAPLVKARAEEIVANIVEQISYADLTDTDLPRGIIIYGGGSNLNRINDLIADISKMPTSVIRKAQLPSYINMLDSKRCETEYIGVLSVLYVGATQSDDECLETVETIEIPGGGTPNEPMVTGVSGSDPIEKKQPKPKPAGIFGKWKNKVVDTITTIFVPSDEEEESDLIESDEK